MNYSCMGCKKRKPGCHDTCEEYAADLAKNEKRKAQIRKGKSDEDVIFQSTRHGKIKRGIKQRKMY